MANEQSEKSPYDSFHDSLLRVLILVLTVV